MRNAGGGSPLENGEGVFHGGAPLYFVSDYRSSIPDFGGDVNGLYGGGMADPYWCHLEILVKINENYHEICAKTLARGAGLWYNETNEWGGAPKELPHRKQVQHGREEFLSGYDRADRTGTA